MPTVSSILIYLGQFLLYAYKLRAHGLTCDYIETNGDLWTRENAPGLFQTSHCESNHICSKTFNITKINITPYYTAPHDSLVEDMLRKCCGNCTPMESSILANMSELTKESISTADMVFPVLAREDTEMLYGFHFVPFVPGPSVFYITRREHKFLMNILSIWPVVIVCLLMAIIAGFLCWIFETRTNEEEFPKPFHF